MVGREPALFEPLHEVLFTDPLDDARIPQLKDVTPVKRFPSFAALRAKTASMGFKHAKCTEIVVCADIGCSEKALRLDPVGQKDEVGRVPNASALKQEVHQATTRATHLVGAAVLCLRKHGRGSIESSANLQKTHSIPKKMMQTALSEVVASDKISKAVEVAKVPRPPSAARRQRATGNGKRPIPSIMQVFTVPVNG